MELNGWNIGGGWGAPAPPKEAEHEAETTDKKPSRRRTVACTELSTKYEYRRAFSEVRMLDAMKHVPLTDGHSYNFITAGDVDSLSYLKVVLNQHNLDYCLCSTWCMAAEDIFQLTEWYRGGANQKARYFRRRDFSRILHHRVQDAARFLRGEPECRQARSLSQPLEDLCVLQ